MSGGDAHPDKVLRVVDVCFLTIFFFNVEDGVPSNKGRVFENMIAVAVKLGHTVVLILFVFDDWHDFLFVWRIQDKVNIAARVDVVGYK